MLTSSPAVLMGHGPWPMAHGHGGGGIMGCSTTQLQKQSLSTLSGHFAHLITVHQIIVVTRGGVLVQARQVQVLQVLTPELEVLSGSTCKIT